VKDGDMDFQTPDWVCKYMVSLLSDKVVTVLEPTPGEGNLVCALKEKNYQVTAPTDFWEVTGRWDAVVMNPPFTPMALGYKILFSCMEMSDEIIALMPWLTIINSEKRAKDIQAFGLVSITHLPRSVFAGARVQTCILQLQRGYNQPTIFRLLSKQLFWMSDREQTYSGF